MSIFKSIVRQLADRLGYRIQCTRFTPKQLFKDDLLRNVEFDDVVCRFMFDVRQDVRFLQIGAYDGISTDPLRKYIDRCGWQGVLVEPQPHCAKQLRSLYGSNPRLRIVEAAIDAQPGARNLYIVDGDDLPKWTGGLASFDRDNVLRHAQLVPGLSEKIKAINVPCRTFDDVISQLEESAIDLLQMDVEGADGKLLALFPFDRFQPAIVQWEIKNLSIGEQQTTLDRLISFGYKVARSGGEDMLAVRPWGSN